MRFIKLVSLLAIFSAQAALAETGAEQGDSDWYPSRYGADDRLGAFNNIDAEKILQATRLVTTGKVYSLAVITAPDTPTGLERSYSMEAYPLFDAPQGENHLSGMDDKVTTHLGIGTQIDGFGHVGIDMKHYNGLPAADILQDNQLAIYGIQDIPPIVTRGVLLDIAALKGVDRLESGTPINRAEIDAAMERQGVTIGKGDVVLLHTGWMSLMEEDGAAFIASEPGLGVEGAEYLASLGVVAVGADNPMLEHVPFANPARPFEVHQILIPKNGVYILEYVRTAELVADQAYEFMFMLAAPRFYGAVQGVVQPVAIR